MEMTTYQAFVYHHRPRLTALAAMAVIIFAQPTLDTLMYGSLVVLLGELGRTWASGYIEKDADLATAGPYAFTRNPLYVSNLTMFLGFCIMSNNMLAALIGIVLFTWIYVVIIGIEARRMVHLFGDSYQIWSEHVPLFIPRLTPWKDRTRKAYSFALMFEHMEHKHWFGMVVGLAIFYLIYYFQNV